MTIDVQDRIEQYLQGRMSDEDRLAFEKEIDANAELKEQVEFTRHVQASIRSRGEKLDKMAMWEREADESQEQETSGRCKPQWLKLLYWSSGIAAVLVVGLVFANMIGSGQVDSPDHGENGIVYRGGGDYAGIDSLLTIGHYDEAIRQVKAEERTLQQELQAITTTKPDEVAEYEGLVLQGQYEALQWLEVKALLGLGDKDAAKVILNQLRQSEGDYRAQADSLYNSLVAK